jgi:pyroglutamyl-peptidase
MKILISGFEPIYNLKRTPSGDLVSTFVSNEIKQTDVELQAIILPQIFRQNAQMLIRATKSFNPEYLIMFGASERARGLKLEKFALNIEDSAIGDNTKIPVYNRTIRPNAPPAFVTPVNVADIQASLQSQSIPSSISYHAGTHTCNSLYYEMLSAYYEGFIKAKPLFVHIPYPSQYAIVDGFDAPQDINVIVGYTQILLSILTTL